MRDGPVKKIPWLPSGYVKIAIENGPFIVSFPIKNGGSFHSYVKLPDDYTTWFTGDYDSPVMGNR